MNESVPKRRKLVTNWLDLPDHVASLFANKLTHIQDYVRFGAVCSSWKSIYTENLRRYFPSSSQVPLLMITTERDQKQGQHRDDIYTRSFYSVLENRVCKFRAAWPKNMICRGSSHGWLMMVDNKCTNLVLFNPFLSENNMIRLPPLSSIKMDPDVDYHCARDEFFIRKAVLTANPLSNPNYVVVVIFAVSRILAICKPGDNRWASNVEVSGYHNVIYCNGRLYAVNEYEELHTIDVNHPPYHVSYVAPRPVSPIPAVAVNKTYLVESSGDLFLIRRILDDGYSESVYFTTAFEIFKLDLVASQWVEVKDLCGRSLFLGENSPICLSSSEFPGCKPNSIYFTDDYFEAYAFLEKEFHPDEPYDVGIFTLEDGSVERHFPLEYKMKSGPAIWIEPTLKRRFN